MQSHRTQAFALNWVTDDEYGPRVACSAPTSTQGLRTELVHWPHRPQLEVGSRAQLGPTQPVHTSSLRACWPAMFVLTRIFARRITPEICAHLQGQRVVTLSVFSGSQCRTRQDELLLCCSPRTSSPMLAPTGCPARLAASTPLRGPSSPQQGCWGWRGAVFRGACAVRLEGTGDEHFRKPPGPAPRRGPPAIPADSCRRQRRSQDGAAGCGRVP